MTPRLPLRYSILGALLALGAALTALSHYTSLSSAEQRIRTELRAHVEALGSMTAANVERGLERGDEPAVRTMVALLATEPYLIQAMLCDERGRVLVSSRYEYEGKSLPAEAQQLARTARRTMTGTVVFDEHNTGAVGIFPVRMGLKQGELRATRIGVLYMSVDLRPMQAIVRSDVLRRTLVMGAIVLATLGALWVVFGLRLTRRIERLNEAFEAVAAGDLQVQVRAARRDEIDLLAQSFNRMTQRLRADRAALSASEARYRALVDASPDGIIVKREGRVVFANATALRLLGAHDTGQVYGRSIFDFTPPAFHDLVRAREAQMGAGGSAPAIEQQLLRLDGSTLDVEISGAAYEDQDGLVVQVVVRDISERVRARDAQLRLERQLLQSQKLQSLGTLAGGIAHDFNNILLAISGNARLALEDCPADHPMRPSLLEIGKASERATALVRRMLMLGRANDSAHAPVELQPVVAEALRLLRAATPAMIEFRTHLPARLPPVLADAGQIHQVVMNLGANSAHAIGERSGVIDVSLDTVDVDETLAAASAHLAIGRYVRLSVADDGSGMDAKTMERMFDPFFTTKEPGQGTGLGLAMVHVIVRNHRGAILVHSSPGRGTRIDVYFPVSERPSSASPQSVTPQPRGARQRVLYLDDEEPLVSLVTRLLQRLNYEVSGFSDPLAAIETFRARPHDFDVAISDLAMPHMSGFDVARTLLNIRPDIPVIMTSGYVRPQDAEQAQRIGVYALILKPNTVEDLARTLDQLFARVEQTT